MRKILIVTWAVLAVLSLGVNSYGQVGEGPLLSGNLFGNQDTTSRVSPLYLDQGVSQNQVFLDRVNSSSAVYADTAVDKMGTGVINTTTAWVEIPKYVSDVSNKENLFAGMTIGLGKGLAYGIRQGASGLVDLATFGIPPYDEPLMQPQYKVENPNQDYKVKILAW
jgi:putative exosortase-associated protein (TIGR04073 family)